MKTVHTNDNVAHLFAHQTQDEARNSGGSFCFYGNTCYSYGSHYVAAKHYGDLVLLNNYNYSVTTGKQMSYLRRACSHLNCIDVANPDAETKAEHRANFHDLKKRYEDALMAASYARLYTETYIEDANRLFDQANDYAKRFKIGNRLKPANVDDLKEKARKQAAKARKAKDLKAKQDRAVFLTKVDAWRSGDLSTYQLTNRHTQPPILRLHNDLVETSHGASFPVEDAPLAIRFVRRCVKQGKRWIRNGEQIQLGPYRLDSISRDGTVKAGCHTVPFGEVEYIAELLRV